MAHPSTAVTAIIPHEKVYTLLTTILTQAGSYDVTFISRGGYGAVFRIDVRIDIPNPFQTFWVSPEPRIIFTSDNSQIHRFCCKIVSINTRDDARSFTNECNKQRDIYAKTNHNLNSVCLPLFFHSIVSTQSHQSLIEFIELIYRQNLDKLPTKSQNFGISFMPYSVNSLTEIAPHNALSILQTDMIIAYLNSASASARASGNPPDEAAVIHIFQTNTPIYSFVVVVSLLVRLYIAGYCHGDLHLENIIVCDFPSGLINGSGNTYTYLKPTFLLIDTGFAFRHEIRLPENIVGDYNSFKTFIGAFITTEAPKSRLTMLRHGPHTWFPLIFMDPIVGGFALNENRCQFIFVLFQQFELYRRNLETHISSNTSSRLNPAIIPNIRAENANLIASVDAYIRSIPNSSSKNSLQIYNSLGGRRRRRNYYYVSKRKQTKRKHHTRSMRRRKSQRRK